MIYQNFDLEIISPNGSGRLCARVLESPQGDCPFIDVKWPFNADEEGVLLSEIYGGLRQRGRSSRANTIQDFGGKLFEAVFSGDIEHLFRSSLDSSSRAGKGLRVRLRLPEDSELHVRPWEFLFDTESREFLAVREHTPLVRYLPVAQPIPPITVEGPLRILVALSSPTDHPRLDIAREWDILRNALEPSISAGQLELRRVPGRCTFDNLRDSLRHFGAHIFHFVGHGIPGALVLEQESGKGLEMEATHLRSAFPSGALPRLIVLNACSGAITQDVPFSGLAQGFLRQGVPAVVAMQASITDDAALIFTRYFYRDLVEIGAVDASLTEARLRMQGNGHPIEWGTPVLYMRALSGQLFQPAAKPIEWKESKGSHGKTSAPLARIEPSLGERKKAKEIQEAPNLLPLQPAAQSEKSKKPRTSRVRESKPLPVAEGKPDAQNAGKKTQVLEPGPNAEQDVTVKMAPEPIKPPPTPALEPVEQPIRQEMHAETPAMPPAEAPDRTVPNILPHISPGELTAPMPSPAPPQTLRPDSAQKAQVWEFAAPPKPESASTPAAAEQAAAPGNRMGESTAPSRPKAHPADSSARPRLQVKKQTPPPTPPEPDSAPSLQPKEFVPVFILEPEVDAPSTAKPATFHPNAAPAPDKNWEQPPPARHFLVPGLAAGLLVAVLGATIGKSYIFPARDSAPAAIAPTPAIPPPASVAGPAPAAPDLAPAPSREPAVVPAPSLSRDATARNADGPGGQVKSVADAQTTPAVVKRKQAVAPARKTQTKPKSAPTAAALNCKSPIPSERDAACLFNNK